MRGRLVRAARLAEAQERTYFQPAGEDAHISFDDEQENNDEWHADRVNPLSTSQAEDEIDLATDQQNSSTKKQGAFAGLFAKKQVKNDETDVTDETTPEEIEAEVSLINVADDIQDAPSNTDDSELTLTQEDVSHYNPTSTTAHMSEPRANGSDTNEQGHSPFYTAAIDKREDDARRAYHEAEEIRRAAREDAMRIAEENEKRIAAQEARLKAEEARLGAEREAEFERKKLQAQEERLRRDNMSAENAHLENLLMRTIDERFASLSEHLDRQTIDIKAAAATPSNLLAANEHELGPLREEVSRMSADFSIHRRNVDAALETLTQHIAHLNVQTQPDNSGAELTAELEELRNDISSLRTTIASDVMGRTQTATVHPFAPAIQLSDIVGNTLPPDAYELRVKLSNDRTADCLIRLPKPMSAIAIDGRFPAETYHKLVQARLDGVNVEDAENSFRRSVLRHIVDISERLISAKETGDAAFMFAPSESIHTELHMRFHDIVQDSYRARVWIVSPTSLMATLNTIRALLLTGSERSSAYGDEAQGPEEIKKLPSQPTSVFAQPDPTPKEEPEISFISNPEKKKPELASIKTDLPASSETPASTPVTPDSDPIDPAPQETRDPSSY